jgi:acetylornithine deacetylase/succinyl-diaminopimelate desuccinylase-like protein
LKERVTIDKRFEEYVHRNLDRFVNDVAQLASQPSVSARNEGIEKCAELVEKMMQQVGIRTKTLRLDGVAPLVYGEMRSSKSSKTVMFYNHYDVQPEEPLELWKSPPFKPQVRDGRLYGRGVCDDKGELVSRLKLIESYVKVNGEPPCNMRFCFEGEEEVGSTHLEEYIAKNQELFKADAVIWELGETDEEGRPIVALGVKGMIYLELIVKSLSIDAHSSYAAALPSAAWRLVRLLNMIKDQNERILVPGWYDDVETLTDEELKLLEEQPFDADGFLKTYGSKGFAVGLGPSQAKKALAQRPTANIAGIWAGYTGPGSKTVLPKEIHCKMDFRLVPNQDPEKLFEKFKGFLKEKGFGDVEIELESMEPAARTSYRDPFVQASIRAGEKVFGKTSVVKVSEAGTGPLYVFTRRYGAPAIMIGVSPPDNAMHAPNENIRIDLFEKGLHWLAETIEGYVS